MVRTLFLGAAAAACMAAGLAGGAAEAQSADPGAAAAEAARACQLEIGRERYRAAVEACSQALALDDAAPGALSREGRATALHDRGAAQMFLGRFGRAVDDLTGALALTPGDPRFQNNRAWAHWLNRDTPAARRDVERAIAQDDRSAYIRDTMAHVLSSEGRRAEALAEYEAAIALSPDYVLLYQEALVRKGYNPGEVDGVYDAQTRAALIACIADDCRLLDQSPLAS